ncbi:MAG: hypothetical protein KAT70_05550, partial [Thermoplasmata archaeon]|nr:hypothetical protein [Thermoplasmata archaeon]
SRSAYIGPWALSLPVYLHHSWNEDIIIMPKTVMAKAKIGFSVVGRYGRNGRKEETRRELYRAERQWTANAKTSAHQMPQRRTCTPTYLYGFWCDTKVLWSVTKMKVDLKNVLYVSETVVTVRGARRRTTVPAKIMESCGISGGDTLRWALLEDGTLLITPMKKR